MGGSYDVVTDISEIARLNEQLNERLSTVFRFGESRVIAYPSGRQQGTVLFESPAGDRVRAWSSRLLKGMHMNFVHEGEPGSGSAIGIMVQLSFPAENYNRRPAGVFIKDRAGKASIAHRGKLTKGKGGLRIASVLREFESLTVEANDDGRVLSVIVISDMENPTLADRLWAFAEKARDVAIRLGQDRQCGTLRAGGPSSHFNLGRP